MNILITNIWLENYGGTECYVRDLAIRLKENGFNVEVYSPKIGEIAQEIAIHGINVSDNPDNLKNIPDLIHGHHTTTLKVIDKFPNVPVVFFSHGIDIHGQPLIHKNIIKYIAVSHYIKEIILEPTIPRKKIEVIYNWVDTNRFEQKDIISTNIQKALIFSNTFCNEDKLTVYEVCNNNNISIESVGWTSGYVNKEPEKILQKYDLVFAKGKCALEALACGCAVILCDMERLGDLITTENLEYTRKYNFGIKTLTHKIDEHILNQLIKKYDPFDVKKVSDKVRNECSFDIRFKQIIKLYKECVKVRK